MALWAALSPIVITDTILCQIDPCFISQAVTACLSLFILSFCLFQFCTSYVFVSTAQYFLECVQST